MKLLKVLVAVLVMAAMAVPVIAEDRLSLSGSMQVRGFVYDVEEGKDDDSGAWNDQRLRIGGKIAVAEGVSVNFRFDVTESDENSSDAVAWGGTDAAAYQYAQRRADVQFDKAYLQVEKHGFTLMAGQQYFGGVGYTRRMADMLGAGFVVKWEGLKLQHVKRMDENIGKNGFTKNNSAAYGPRDEVSMTVLSYDFKGEGFSLTPAIAYNDNQNVDDTDFYGAALAGSVDLGPVALKGEFNYFDGETDGDADGELPLYDWKEGDLVGTQLYLDASLAATDTLRVGAMFLYAAGTDKDDETQITNMNNDGTIDWTFAEWNPQTYGYWSGDILGELDIFDPTGSSAGVIAGSLYADLKATEDMSFKFSGLYMETEEDKAADADGYFLNASVNYKLAENTSLIAHANYTDITDNDATDGDFELFSMITGVVVSF
jgi:hypothetical protein